jgi:putative SOS response-associated peptidase YedK
MCGRYSLAQPIASLKERYGVEQDALSALLRPRYNIAPTQDAIVILDDGDRKPDRMRWGLVPSWAKDPAIGLKAINARSETAAERPAFREALERRRCLIPADGFYEWRTVDKKRQPLRFTLVDEPLFSFAGLWDRWRAPDGREWRTFTILTTGANELIKPVHDRMPVILRRSDEAAWISPNTTGSAAQLLLQPYDARAMRAAPVSAKVNAASYDAPDVWDPPEDAGQMDLLYRWSGMAARAARRE